MKHVFTILSALSLILCAAAIEMWTLSYFPVRHKGWVNRQVTYRQGIFQFAEWGVSGFFYYR